MGIQQAPLAFISAGGQVKTLFKSQCPGVKALRVEIWNFVFLISCSSRTKKIMSLFVTDLV